MKAIRIEEPGGPEVLRLVEVEEPRAGPDDLLVRVRATALNRADVLQRRGLYPAPPGSPPDIPGLEYAGEVLEAGERVRDLGPGDRVMGLLGGGGYAERVRTPASLALPVPEGLGWREAAAVPEVFLTAWDALFRQARLGPGERVLVHTAGGGVGTAAVQLARLVGAARIFGTASRTKLEGLEALGLAPDVAVDRHGEAFADVVERETAGRGVHVLLDTVGADYWGANVACAAVRGRIVLVGLLGGSATEARLGPLLRGRIRVFGTVLRARPLHEKASLVAEARDRMVPLLADGRLRPVVDRVFPLAEAADAHRYLEADRNLGKVVLEV